MPLSPIHLDHQVAVRAAIPILQKIGRDENRQLARSARLPPSLGLTVLFKEPEAWVGPTAQEVEWLIRGLVLLEQERDYDYGSINPVPRLYTLYRARTADEDTQNLGDWIMANSTSAYVPWGTSNFGAKSLEELHRKESERAEAKRATGNAERARELEAKKKMKEAATLKLPGAIRRKDKVAIRALLAKGADLDAPGPDGFTPRQHLQELDLIQSLDTHLP